MTRPATNRKTAQAAFLTAAFYIALAGTLFLVNSGAQTAAQKDVTITERPLSIRLSPRARPDAEEQKNSAAQTVKKNENPARESQPTGAAKKTDSATEAAQNNPTAQIPSADRAQNLPQSAETAGAPQKTSDYSEKINYGAIVITDNTSKQDNPNKNSGADSGKNALSPTDVKPSYMTELDEKIRERLRYPERARKRNMEGTVSFRLTIDTAGNLIKYDMTASSNYPLLDRAASVLIEEIFPLRSKPEETAVSTINIRYALTNAL